VHTVADIYIPFRLFRVQIRNRERTEVQIFGLDAVRGSFDLYSFPSLPDSREIVHVQTENHPPAMIDGKRAQEILVERVRRIVFTRGFFQIESLGIQSELIPMDIHVPYWVGFSGPPDNLNLTVMDAIRRRFEGAKVQEFVREWLSGTPSLY